MLEHDGLRQRGAAGMGLGDFTEVRLDGGDGKGIGAGAEVHEHAIDAAETKQGLNTFRLAALTFFTVSGGPYGLEPLVKEGGPQLAIIGLLVVPWVWGLPSAFMTAELASALPEMGGYIVWVQRTMGDFWAFQNAIWNIFSNCLDNALYPVLFVDYLEEMLGHDLDGITRAWIGVSMVAVLGLVNVVGVDVVGDGAGVFGVFVILPFIVLVIVGFASGESQPEDWFETIPSPDIGNYVAILLWNTCGYDSAGTCAAEVEDPGRIYPRAMLLTVVVTTLLYVLPIMVGVGFLTEYGDWDDGQFVEVGDLVGGAPLKWFVSIAATVSALGLLNSTMCTSSRALACMAGFGYVPSSLARIHPTYGTPIVAIFVNSVAISGMVLSGLNFEAIAQLSMWLYALTLAFEFFALILLRRNEPDLERPYIVPGGMIGLYALSLPPLVCCVALMWLSSRQTWIICGAILAFGLLALIPFYAFSGKPVVLPGPLACLVRLCCRCYAFKPVGSFDARVASETSTSTEDSDPVDWPVRRDGRNGVEFVQVSQMGTSVTDAVPMVVLSLGEQAGGQEGGQDDEQGSYLAPIEPSAGSFVGAGAPATSPDPAAPEEALRRSDDDDEGEADVAVPSKDARWRIE